MKALDLADELMSDNEHLAVSYSEIAAELRRLAAVEAERDALKAENERLTNCLKKANDQAEDFERRWYLADMELERIKALEPVATVMAYPTPSVSYSIRAIHWIPHGTKLYALGSKTDE